MSKTEETTKERIDSDPDEGKLIRGLGPLETTTIIVGGVIGSGIFRAPSLIAQEVGSPGMSLVVWVVCGLIALCGGLCIAELGAMLPRTGGQYVYIREAYRKPILSFLYGWAAFWLVWPVSIAAVANVFATYLASVVYTINGNTLGPWAQRFIAVGSIVLLSAINCVGVRAGGKVTNWFTYLKVLAIGALIVLGFAMSEKGSMSHFSPLWGTESAGGFGFAAFGAAMLTCLYAYEGWNFSSYVAGEIKNPRRNIPLSIIVGMGCVTALYLMVNLVYIYVLPFDQFQASKWVAADAMEALVGPSGALIISIGVMCSTFGGTNVQILVSPRIFYALANDGLFFKSLTKVHPKFKTPANSIIWQGTLASIFSLTGRYDDILSYGSFVSYVIGLLVILAVIVLRVTRPDADRPYKVWGYPVTPAIFIAVILGYLVSLLVNWQTLKETLIGIGIVATGVPFYFYWIKTAKRQG